MIYTWLARAGGALVFIATLIGIGWHFGSNHVQKGWDADKAQQSIALSRKQQENDDAVKLANQRSDDAQRERQALQSSYDTLSARFSDSLRQYEVLRRSALSGTPANPAKPPDASSGASGDQKASGVAGFPELVSGVVSACLTDAANHQALIDRVTISAPLP